MGLKVGDTAPDFSLLDAESREVRLRDFKGKKSVVLYFYPKDETSGCTKEACTFRDHYEAFREAGAEVIGISSDSVDSHQGFATHHRLPFLLLSDEGGKVRKLYGVPSTWGLLPGRMTFVIDRKGIIRHLFNSQFNPTRHVKEALRILSLQDSH